MQFFLFQFQVSVLRKAQYDEEVIPPVAVPSLQTVGWGIQSHADSESAPPPSPPNPLTILMWIEMYHWAVSEDWSTKIVFIGSKLWAELPSILAWSPAVAVEFSSPYRPEKL
jgi:hypothetical protein